MAAPKKYPDELRARAVRLYRESDPEPTIRRLAEQLNVHHEACGVVVVQRAMRRSFCGLPSRPPGAMSPRRLRLTGLRTQLEATPDRHIWAPGRQR